METLKGAYQNYMLFLGEKKKKIPHIFLLIYTTNRKTTNRKRSICEELSKYREFNLYSIIYIMRTHKHTQDGTEKLFFLISPTHKIL